MKLFILRRHTVFVFALILVTMGVFLTSAQAKPVIREEQAREGTPLVYLPSLVREEQAPEGTPLVYLPSFSTPRVDHPTQINFEPFVTGLNTKSINAITHAHDSRLFIVEREGYVRIVFPNGTLHPSPFLDIHTLVGTSNWEEGLLGLVFHPNYPNTPYFYISYTHQSSKSIYLDRVAVSADPNAADPASRVSLFAIAKPSDGSGISPVHNGGDLHFGPDGYLYMGVGDGGPDPWVGSNIPGDPDNNAQSIYRLLGKMLRIDVNQSTGIPPECGSQFYSIPADNPYVGVDGCDEIWAIGLRNPWRFSFDRLTGDMFIGDVGEWQREELNFQAAGTGGGRHYGWHCWEGTLNYSTLFPQVNFDCNYDNPGLYTPPIFEYTHASGGCSIVGGYMYRGSKSYAFYGDYIFADFCSGYWLAHQDTAGVWVFQAMGNTGFFISTFGEGADGELYAGSWRSNGTDNTLYKVLSING